MPQTIVNIDKFEKAMFKVLHINVQLYSTVLDIHLLWQCLVPADIYKV